MKAAAYCATRNLYPDLIPAIKSLLMHSDVDKIYLLIEDDAFPEPLPDACECINVSRQMWFRPGGPNWSQKWTWMVLMRCALTKILPETLDRVLSLDADTIVERDISELWDLDLTGWFLAAVREPRKSSPKTSYFNAGVVMYHLAQLRAEGMDDKLIRALNEKAYECTDQDAINTYVLDDDSKQTLPTGPIIEGLAPDGEAEGRKRYWLGDTPETAADDGQVLVYLLHDEATDELDAFRTSRAMLDAGERPVDVSLYLFRDSKSDRMGEEKYNALFFDTPEGEKSLVKVMTDVLEGRDLEVPKSLRIVLRGFDLGADLPAYSLTDHFFAMNDGVGGKVSMFDGFYEASFDGDVFDSDYTRIEGIVNNDLTVTVKQGQSIWPEWTGKDAAEDIGGESYKRLDGVWYNENELPLPEDAAAA